MDFSQRSRSTLRHHAYGTPSR